MKRRQVIATLGGATLLGGGFWVSQNGLPGTAGADGAVRVETIDAPGSSAGRVLVPQPGRVTVIDLFATWCEPCKKQMSALTAVHRTHGDDATFVSVTNERVGETLTRADIREWWDRHDGAWTVGLDPSGDVMAAVDASGLPYLVIADENGDFVWRHQGVASEATLRSALDEVV